MGMVPMPRQHKPADRELTADPEAHVQQRSLKPRETGPLRALFDMGQAMNRAITKLDVLKIAASFVPKLIRAERASVTLLDSSTVHCTVMALEGNGEVYQPGTLLPVDSSLVGRAIKSQSVVVTHDAGQRTERDAQALSGAGLKAMINIPLVVGQRVIGTLNFACMEAGTYDEFDIDHVLQGASLLASSLESRQLMEETSRALKRSQEQALRMRLLNEFGQELLKEVDEEGVMRACTRFLPRFLSVDHISIGLLVGLGERIRYTSWIPFRRSRIHDRSYPIDDSMAADCLQEEVILNIPDLKTISGSDAAGLREEGLASMVMAPLVMGPRVGGYVQPREPNAGCLRRRSRESLPPGRVAPGIVVDEDPRLREGRGSTHLRREREPRQE